MTSTYKLIFATKKLQHRFDTELPKSAKDWLTYARNLLNSAHIKHFISWVQVQKELKLHKLEFEVAFLILKSPAQSLPQWQILIEFEFLELK